MTTTPSMKKHGVFTRLYRGETNFRFVERRRTWFAISLAIIAIGLISLGVRGFNFGIEFKGGTSWSVLANGATVDEMNKAVTATGLQDVSVVELGSGKGRTLEVQASINSLATPSDKALNTSVITAMAAAAHTEFNQVSVSQVGPTWGGDVTKRALWALLVFFIAVGIYISFRFEPKMALAAFLAMLHDLLITVGVYSIFNFQITPDTVVAVLTILGYSLYDTVVVFDRVTDNVRQMGSTSNLTYSEIVDLSMNQTLARSINTSLVAILPVLSVLFVGALLLGATTLLNYGVALFVGLVAGTYSSIFIASPVLAILKEREPKYRALRERLENRRDRTGTQSPLETARQRSATAVADRGEAVEGTIRPTGPTFEPGTASAAPRGRTQRGKKRR
ncbi:MAG: protein translocase subunit SecF [Actinomycetota bacterium]